MQGKTGGGSEEIKAEEERGTLDAFTPTDALESVIEEAQTKKHITPEQKEQLNLWKTQLQKPRLRSQTKSGTV